MTLVDFSPLCLLSGITPLSRAGRSGTHGSPIWCHLARPASYRARPAVVMAGSVHEDLFSMAAAYALHIAESQAFLDGNKRVGVLAAIVFLDLNGFRILNQDDVLYLAMMVAERSMLAEAKPLAA